MRTKNYVLLVLIVLIFGSSGCLHAWIDSDAQVVSEAGALNNFFQHEEAKQLLDELIRSKPKKLDAYKERAFAHFELGNVNAALADYYQVKSIEKGNLRKKYLYPSAWITFPKSEEDRARLDFCHGLAEGTLAGNKDGTVDFVSSLRGGLTFLWSLVCSPLEVSKDLIDALYAIGEFIAHARFNQYMDVLLPEVQECRDRWDQWSDYTKGHKIGYIVGKYSLLGFYYVATPRCGAYIYRNLKHANMMAILESYATTKSPSIINASSQYAKKSTFLLDSVAKGCIIPHNPNVLPHIFTKKHRWDEYLKLTGNLQTDFKSLTSFLEKHQILSYPRKIDFHHRHVITYRYVKPIGKDVIIATFEVNKNNLHLLRNAWIEDAVKGSSGLK